MNIERIIEDAVVTRLEARTYFTTNSISARRYDDRYTKDNNVIALVACHPVERIEPNYNRYMAILEGVALNNSEHDVEGDAVIALYDDILDEYMNDMTAAALTTSIGDASVVVDGVVGVEGNYEGGDEYKLHTAQVRLFITYSSPFQGLYSEATVVGSSALPVACVRTGARQSVDVNTSAEVAANTADKFNMDNTIDDVITISSMTLATNTVPTDLDLWGVGSNLTSVDNLDGTWTVTCTGIGSAFFEACCTTIIAGETATYSMVYSNMTDDTETFQLRGSASLHVQYDGTVTILGGWANVTTDLTEIQTGVYRLDVTGDAPAGTTDVDFFLVNDPAISWSAKFHGPEVRAAETSVRIAASPADSAADASYGTDIVRCVPTFASSGFVAIPFTPYGWSNTGNPANAQAVIFEATGLSVVIDASGFFATSTGATSTEKPVSDTLSVIMVWWDGVNHYISVDDETPVSVASAVAPSSTTYIGNTSAGTKPAHAAQHTAIWGSVPTAAERTTLYDGYVDIFGSITYR